MWPKQPPGSISRVAISASNAAATVEATGRYTKKGPAATRPPFQSDDRNGMSVASNRTLEQKNYNNVRVCARDGGMTHIRDLIPIALADICSQGVV